MAINDSYESTAFERSLAYITGVLVVVSILCFFYIILAGVFRYSLENAISQIIFSIPSFALPLAFVTMFTLIITNMIRRRKKA